MADTIEGLPEGAVVGPSLQKQDQAQVEGLPEGAIVGPSLQTAPTAHGAGGSWEPQSTTSKVWEGANQPMIPEGRAETEGKEYSTSAPTLSETEHPYLTGAKKGLAGAYADTLETARRQASCRGWGRHCCTRSQPRKYQEHTTRRRLWCSRRYRCTAQHRARKHG